MLPGDNYDGEKSKEYKRCWREERDNNFMQGVVSKNFSEKVTFEETLKEMMESQREQSMEIFYCRKVPGRSEEEQRVQCEKEQGGECRRENQRCKGGLAIKCFVVQCKTFILLK